jgi:hypothetical protein
MVSLVTKSPSYNKIRGLASGLENIWALRRVGFVQFNDVSVSAHYLPKKFNSARISK